MAAEYRRGNGITPDGRYFYKLLVSEEMRGCLYINKLADVDQAILATLIEKIVSAYEKDEQVKSFLNL